MTAKIIPLTPHQPPPPAPDQLYREAAWRFLHVCFSNGRVNYIREAAEEMEHAKTKTRTVRT